jgi:DNA polymerase/3'-5' exonuclease PolX
LKSKSYLEELIQKLKTDIHLETETITIGANKFLGLVKLTDRKDSEDSKWRHLDMRLVDIVSFPFAWSYFSSGKVFNKFIRERVKKRGYKLNEYGIYNSETGKRVILEGEIDLSQLKTKVMNKKDMLEYAERIEQKLFKLADVEYQTIRERY